MMIRMACFPVRLSGVFDAVCEKAYGSALRHGALPVQYSVSANAISRIGEELTLRADVQYLCDLQQYEEISSTIYHLVGEDVFGIYENMYSSSAAESDIPNAKAFALLPACAMFALRASLGLREVRLEALPASAMFALTGRNTVHASAMQA